MNITETPALIKAKATIQKAVAKTRKAFTKGIPAIFDAHPTLLAFRWAQYPQYNDEEDVFSLNEPLLKIEGVEGEYDGYSDGYENDAAKPILNDISAYLDGFDTEDMETAFGDCAEITVTRDAVEIDQCAGE